MTPTIDKFYTLTIIDFNVSHSHAFRWFIILICYISKLGIRREMLRAVLSSLRVQCSNQGTCFCYNGYLEPGVVVRKSCDQTMYCTFSVVPQVLKWFSRTKTMITRAPIIKTAFNRLVLPIQFKLNNHPLITHQNNHPDNSPVESLRK